MDGRRRKLYLVGLTGTLILEGLTLLKLVVNVLLVKVVQ
ncbi:hypothetical protein SAMN05443253_1247 [Bacillus sp. OK048]|nr:hypothetical protein SAMN05443253_1247 [Bacillus sp. OK048]